MDRLMRHIHGKGPGMQGINHPAIGCGDRLGRPLVRQHPRDHFVQGRVEHQQAGLGAAGVIQCPLVCPVGRIDPRSTIARNLAADRRHRSPQMAPKLPKGVTFNQAPRYLLPVRQAGRSRFAPPGHWRKTTRRRDGSERRSRVLVQRRPNTAKRFPRLPTPSEHGPLLM